MIGEILGGQYQVVALLGVGSMGEVYKGWDRALSRHVAIKVLKPEVGSGIERFRSEAQILASLNQGNICQVYSFFQHLGRDIMVLQYLDGLPLDQVLVQKGRLPLAEVKSIAADILAGLIEAHHAKVVHRDLKPANLMLAPAAIGFKTIIMDFGIARAQGQARATREGMVACTIEYASPEQIQGDEVDASSDLYSLSMVLYELLVGELAFPAKTDAAWAHAHVYEDPAWSKLAALHGKEIVQFLSKASEKKANKRYPNAQAMLSALNQVSENRQDLKIAWKKRFRHESFLKVFNNLKENWAFVFLGVMSLVGVTFLLLSQQSPEVEEVQSVEKPTLETQVASSHPSNQQQIVTFVPPTKELIINEPAQTQPHNLSNNASENQKQSSQSENNKKIKNKENKNGNGTIE